MTTQARAITITCRERAAPVDGGGAPAGVKLQARASIRILLSKRYYTMLSVIADDVNAISIKFNHTDCIIEPK